MSDYRTVRVPSGIIDALRRGETSLVIQGERGFYPGQKLMFDELAPGSRWALRYVVSAAATATGSRLFVRDDGVNP